MKEQLRAGICLFVLLTLLTGVAYPAIVTMIAQTVFHDQANGNVIEKDGKSVGSKLIGQPFESMAYFWGRPSATGPVPFNAAASTGSNLGPTNPAHLGAVRSRIEKIRTAHPDQNGPIPVDLVTTSLAGLIRISVRRQRNIRSRVSQNLADCAKPMSLNLSPSKRKSGPLVFWEKGVSMFSNSILPWIGTQRLPREWNLNMRNPPFGMRVFIVSFVLAVFGGLGGLMCAIVFGYVFECTLLGCVAGAIAGAMLEAYSG